MPARLAASLAVLLLLVPRPAAAQTPSYSYTIGSLGSGDGQLAAPRGISIQGNEVYVLEYGNKRVSVFDLDGNFLRKWGQSGSGDGQIFQPTRILVTPDQSVYISDFVNHNVQVFDANGVYLRKWGGFGTGDTQFNYPYGMAYDSEGNIWVSDRGNQVIKRFTPQGVHLETIDTSEVNGCTDIVVTADAVYGSMWGNTFGGVRQWDRSGNYIGQSTVSWTRSEGIVLGPDGKFYVAAGAPVHSVYVLDSGLSQLAKWGGYGTGDTQLADPWDVGVSDDGRIYVPLDDAGVVKVFAYPTSVESASWGSVKASYR